MNNATTWDAGYGMVIPPTHPIPLKPRQIISLRCGMVFGGKIHPIPLNLNEINSGMRDGNFPLKGTRGTSSHVAPGDYQVRSVEQRKLKDRACWEMLGSHASPYRRNFPTSTRAREYLYLEDIVQDDVRASFTRHRARAREMRGEFCHALKAAKNPELSVELTTPTHACRSLLKSAPTIPAIENLSVVEARKALQK